MPAAQLSSGLQACPPPKQRKLERSPCNPLLAYPRTEYWVYADYKHMSQLCSSCPELLAAIDWAEFGFEGRGGEASTMWLGCEGSFTPCHFDTYGCNLVAQLWGQKRWLLYPPWVSGPHKHAVPRLHSTAALPQESLKLCPTRVPFEESSVFSSINVTSDVPATLAFATATQYEV